MRNIERQKIARIERMIAAHHERETRRARDVQFSDDDRAWFRKPLTSTER